MKKSNKIKVLKSEKRDLKKEVQFLTEENNSYLASLKSSESDVSKLEDELTKCNSETCGAVLQIESLKDDNKDLIKSIQRYKGMIKKLEADAVARNVKEFGTEYHPDDVAFNKKHFSDDFLDQLKSFNTKDAEDIGLSDEFIAFGERLYNLKHFGTNYNPSDIVDSSVVRGRPNFDKKEVVDAPTTSDNEKKVVSSYMASIDENMKNIIKSVKECDISIGVQSFSVLKNDIFSPSTKRYISFDRGENKIYEDNPMYESFYRLHPSYKHSSANDVVEPSATFSSLFMPNVKFKIPKDIDNDLLMNIILSNVPSDELNYRVKKEIKLMSSGLYCLATTPNGSLRFLIPDYMYSSFDGRRYLSDPIIKIDEVSIYEAIPELVPGGMVYDKESDTLIYAKILNV